MYRSIAPSDMLLYRSTFQFVVTFTSDEKKWARNPLNKYDIRPWYNPVYVCIANSRIMD